MNKITGILLAGGQSSRMGREKGEILLGSQKLYTYPLRVLESLCDEILISTCKPWSLPEEHSMVCDEIKEIGPIGGIYTCLKRSSNEINIILSYDLALVNPDLFEEMLKYISRYDLVVPAMKNGHPEPLCGIYKKGNADTIQKMISDKIFGVHHLFPRLHTFVFRVNESMPFYHPNIFLNINSEEDLLHLPGDFGK